MTCAHEIVSDMAAVLAAAAHPRRIILFGSRARGEATPDSDYDIMVIEDEPVNRFSEMIRLRRLLRYFPGSIDLVVVSKERFDYWRDTPGNVYYDAATEGTTLYEAA